jgi:hypothetical protein
MAYLSRVPMRRPSLSLGSRSGRAAPHNPDNGTATLTLDNSSSVSRNTATATDGGGGGIFNNGGTLIIPNGVVTKNTSDNMVG